LHFISIAALPQHEATKIKWANKTAVLLRDTFFVINDMHVQKSATMYWNIKASLAWSYQINLMAFF
jgi:hypothetical protein